MRNLMIGALALVLLFGCVGQWNPPGEEERLELEKELNHTVAVPDKGLISVSGGENLSVVTIRAADTGGWWQFPLQDYPDEFMSEELYSISFIRLDHSHIGWLGENETIWLTPMVKDGKGVLFNAVYANEIGCNATTVRILGKDYLLSQLEYEPNAGFEKEGGWVSSSGFENDDKWKVWVEGKEVVPPNMTKEQQMQYVLSSYREFCPVRVVVFMDGYFSDLKDGEQISLFRNDNTVLFGFENLESGPQVKVVATRPAGNGAARSGPDYLRGVYNVTDEASGREYNMTEQLDRSGLSLEFQPGIPVCTGCDPKYGQPADWHEASWWELSENDRIGLEMLGTPWVISVLRKDANGEQVMLGREDANWIVDAGDSFVMDGKNITFANYTHDYASANPPGSMIITLRDEDGTEREMNVPGIISYDNDKYLRAWTFAPGFTWDSSWVSLSSFSEVVELSGNATLSWENETSGNPALKSVFIPASSPIFEKLTG